MRRGAPEQRPAPPPRPTRRRPGASGFTLIEMLAVVGFTALLMLFAVNFYLDVTRASEVATEKTRSSRRAVAVLDRIARDLEATLLVRKPEEVDPLFHPWVFLAEDRGGDEGAEHLRFTTRSRIPRSTATHEADYQVVSYALREADEGGLELLRWSSPRLPEELDRSFPTGELEGAVLFAEGLASFGVRFMSDTGEWQSEWDSSTLVDSSELPLAAEISVSFLPERDDPLAEEELDVYLRRVLIPVRPLDVEALLAGEEEEEGAGCSTGATVRECVEGSDELADLLESQPDLQAVVEEFGNDCFSTHAASFGMEGECP